MNVAPGFSSTPSTVGTRILARKAARRSSSRHTPVHIGYRLSEDSVEEEVCYWRDMAFGPHPWNLLQKSAIDCQVTYGIQQSPTNDRKTLATRMRTCVSELGEADAIDPVRPRNEPSLVDWSR